MQFLYTYYISTRIKSQVIKRIADIHVKYAHINVLNPVTLQNIIKLFRKYLTFVRSKFIRKLCLHENY